MELCDIGLFIQSVQEGEDERMQAMIGILSELADDIYSGIASILNSKAKRVPMRNILKRIEQQNKPKPTQEEIDSQSALVWLAFLGKTELLQSHD